MKLKVSGPVRKNRRISLVYAPVIVIAVLLLSTLCSSTVGADSAFGDKISGTYLLTEDDDGGSRIVTITADGNWFGIHSYQLDNKFSNQQGVWKKRGDRKIVVSTLNFSLLKDGVGSSRFAFTIEFDNTFQHVTGEHSGKVFPHGVDPLDPLAIPIKTFSNTFTGKRLIVTDK
ncbi:MAG: hypothetical protein HON76_04455 [Candidatus Scalindua sp.]|jgi:hypothetical protein|nr:hypothetical protein [Candidatus Scalindua sp.]MBT5305520.1 hypothetical protein [Candidatus Scalindua sp.]MBT6048392.1 hypothetical protein [Candidatus Scalindua sp.]MBT6561762.1 hypothetical protein [Candidatus Scalindua sp.]MBT7210415.1 hypothetical protein [Candidatus Scalindua sp.]